MLQRESRPHFELEMICDDLESCKSSQVESLHPQNTRKRHGHPTDLIHDVNAFEICVT